MDIYDFHTHIFPDSLAERAISKLKSVSPEAQNYTDGTISGLRASMGKKHITKSVLLPVATKASQVSVINDDAKKLKNDPDFIAFGALHPKTENFDEVTNYLKENGIPGIKLHPEYQDFYIDSPDIFPMYEALSSAGLITIFHAGKDPGPFTCDHALPNALKKVHQNFPHLKMVAAHLGGWRVWNEVEEILCGLPIYFDTAAIQNDLSEDAFVRIVRKHGISRIVFGSDSPWFDQGDSFSWIDRTKLSDSEKEAIFSRNAIGLLGL